MSKELNECKKMMSHQLKNTNKETEIIQKKNQIEIWKVQ